MNTSRVLILVCLMAALTAPLLAAERGPVYRDDCVPLQDSLDAAPSSAGLWVYTDEDTGELRRRLAAEQSKTRSLNWSSEGLTVVVHPDGMKSVDLEGRFMSDFVVRIDASGNADTACIDDPGAATAVTPRWEEK